MSSPVWTEFPDFIRHYAGASDLDGAEKEWLNRHAATIRTSSLLDLGYGGGRTTLHLAPQVGEYLGLEMDPAMCEAAQNRLPQFALQLQAGNAENLSMLPEARFDAVWFSFNGIDYTPPERIPALLRGVARVLKPGGSFFFSGHHLEAYPCLFEIDPAWSWIRRCKRAMRYGLVRLLNASRQRPDAAWLFDPLYFTSPTRIWRAWRLGRGCFTYASPTWWEKQLQLAGFQTITVWQPSGKPWNADASTRPLWLHYDATR